MEDNKELVVEETTENVEEQPTEEVVEPLKIYTEEDLNHKIDEILPKKLNRKEEKIRREYEKKYGELEDILKTGLNVNSIEEATENLKNMYEKRGIEIPTHKNNLTPKQEQILATAEAKELIDGSSLDEVEEEMKSLADKGFENMTSYEKVVFTTLNEYYTKEKGRVELTKAGITDEILKDQDYIDITSKFNPNLTEKEKYDLYKQLRPNKPKVEPMGSMKGTASQETGVKDFYTREEALQFTREDFDKNPELFKAVENSMLKWK